MCPTWVAGPGPGVTRTAAAGWPAGHLLVATGTGCVHHPGVTSNELVPGQQALPRELLLLGGQGQPAPRDLLAVWAQGAGLAVFALFSVLLAAAAPGELAGGNGGLAAVFCLAAAALCWTAFRVRHHVLPQRAWLTGSILTVGEPGPPRHCDLASAAAIKLTRRSAGFGGYDLPPVLYACQGAGSPPVRVVLRGPDLRPLPAAQLRLLAQAIEAHRGPLGPERAGAAQQLRNLAARQEAGDPPAVAADWSHRTGPG